MPKIYQIIFAFAEQINHQAYFLKPEKLSEMKAALSDFIVRTRPENSNAISAVFANPRMTARGFVLLSFSGQPILEIIPDFSCEFRITTVHNRKKIHELENWLKTDLKTCPDFAGKYFNFEKICWEDDKALSPDSSLKDVMDFIQRDVSGEMVEAHFPDNLVVMMLPATASRLVEAANALSGNPCVMTMPSNSIPGLKIQMEDDYIIGHGEVLFDSTSSIKFSFIDAGEYDDRHEIDLHFSDIAEIFKKENTGQIIDLCNQKKNGPRL